MLQKEQIITEAITILDNNLGGYFARTYKDFYNTSETEEILLSLKTILEDLVGPKSARTQLSNLCVQIGKEYDSV